ncbi:NAD-dependent protein deacylase sirtuin-6-like isoform X2 [Dreissena polymorpha]|uniref:NAD-dependent protein deacylase sirtuin-6-like isoform X2 n=1 Tax=Dreissena polymorpha TaxID=45954 RepID=UPI00226426EF|nr:NAD-dependent protein deacylase sirtuin-6-like isoform X2 [Dreissena polymorpha]
MEALKTSLKCCLKDCSDSSALDQHVAVKTVLSIENGKSSLKSKFMVRWKTNGEAEFHKACWDQIYLLARARTKQGIISLTKEEKAMIKIAAESAEMFDSFQHIKHAAGTAASWIRDSNQLVVFTGAGISTSAGIGDYRGKAGKWTEEDQIHAMAAESKEPVSKKAKLDADAENDSTCDLEGVPYEKLRPTYTHEALKKLHKDGYLKYVISQNGDGLHRLSGISAKDISELHGNVFIETCEKCKKIFERPYYVLDDESSQYYEEIEDFGKSHVKKKKYAKKCTLCGLSHRTGRRCDDKKCDGYLQDTIINFRDHLDESTLVKAEEMCRQCDVMLCLGTTLQVTPACDLVKNLTSRDRLIICNRQETPLDRQFQGPRANGCRVFGNCDVFIREMMGNLYQAADLAQWESERETRLAEYDISRA